MKKLDFICVVFVLFFQHNFVQAYSYSGNRWYGNPTYKVASNMGTGNSCSEFLTTGNSYRNDFNCALKAWNDLEASYLIMYNSTDNDSYVSSYNLQNEVAFVADLDDGALGYHWYSYSLLGNEIYESDITFDASPDDNDPWIIGAPEPSINTYQNFNVFRQAALHEIGHGRGLDHYNVRIATMNKLYPAGGWYRGTNYGGFSNYFGRFWPHPDDVAGDKHIYPNSTATGRDLAVVRATAPILGVVFDVNPVYPNGSSLSTYLCPTEYLRIHYTVENRGNETIPTTVWAFLSLNNWISPVDFRVGGKSHILQPYGHEEISHNFYLPSNTPPGEYYVGVFVDPDDYITDEQDELNNNGVSLDVAYYGNKKVSVLPSNSTLCQ